MAVSPKKTFINLPVKDLEKSMAFFERLGFSFNPDFTNGDAACMVINEHTYAMLLTEGHFQNFTSKSIADSSKNTEVIVALTLDSKEHVDEVFNKAQEAGATPASEPMEYEFMYQRSFEDPDSHIWELFYMDENAR